MAEKPRFIVIRGCIQEGREIYVEGQEYIPPSAEIGRQLLDDGVIAPSDRLAAVDSTGQGKGATGGKGGGGKGAKDAASVPAENAGSEGGEDK